MIDLHTHSLFSDGDLTPSEVVKRAKQKGVSVLSLTDHDCILGLEEARLACEQMGIQFIPGVELEAATDISQSNYIHILGYNFDKPEILDQYLKTLREERLSIINKYIELLNHLGFNTCFDEINALTPGMHLTTYHIPVFLYKKGYYETFEAAKKDFLHPDGKYYISRNYYDVDFIIDLIIRAGGIPVLAHPCRLPQKNANLDSYISTLKQKGLMGIETYYSQHTAADILFYESLAKKYNLLQTAGSDWHSSTENIEIGMNPFNEEKIVNTLLNYSKSN